MNDVGNLSEGSEVRCKHPFVQEVREEHERMILGGEVQAGTRLKEHNLATQMGVSRAPVREAALSLERDGLVTAVPNQGVFVRELSVEDALKVYDLRAIIAGYLCERVAARVESKSPADRRARVTRWQMPSRQKMSRPILRKNLAIHDATAEAAHAPCAAALYVGLGKQVRLLRLRVLADKESMRFSIKEHDQIVLAIEQGNNAKARIVRQTHHRMARNHCTILCKTGCGEAGKSTECRHRQSE